MIVIYGELSILINVVSLLLALYLDTCFCIKVKNSLRLKRLTMNSPPEKALEAIFVESVDLTKESVETVAGYDFNRGVSYEEILGSYKNCGYQATNFGLAIDEINRMLAKRKEPLEKECLEEEDEFIRLKSNCTIFLGYTSNMVSSGLRETLRFLVQHKMVDCVVTTAGGVEEDIIKCLAPTFLGDFYLKGSQLRDRGLNRIGNLLVPNNNYCKFEDFLTPILDKLVDEQTSEGTVWSPSKIINRLGIEINNPESICYWAAKNKIPIFSPALTDGSFGDQVYFHSYRKPGLVIDIAQDIRRINSIAVNAANTGMVIIGGSLVKHHICNANLMRNGADYAVFVNTSHDFDGSDAGARPDEAVSWGKIKKEASPVKICADATLVFPLLVAETFAKEVLK